MWRVLAMMLLLLTACRSAAPAQSPRAQAVAATATPNPSAGAIALVPLRIDESPLPPAEPTPPGFSAGRPTATPAVTPEPGWKYVTITLALENRSTQPYLVAIAGADPLTTNLNQAVLTSPDGTRYKPVRTSSSLGLRTATSHALNSYPVLLRLPPAFRVAAESGGSVSVVAPAPTQLTFRVPSSLSQLGTLAVPPPSSLSSKPGDDDVTRNLRPLLGGFAPLDLASGARTVTFPLDVAPAPSSSATSADAHVSVVLLGVEAAEPADFEIRNRGWKQLTVSLQFHNDDAQQARAFQASAWLFGDDGVVYTGDAPTIGDFGRSVSAPEASAMLLWDGRSVATEVTPPGQALEPRRPTFFVPRGLHTAILVLAGDVDATFSLSGLPDPG